MHFGTSNTNRHSFEPSAIKYLQEGNENIKNYEENEKKRPFKVRADDLKSLGVKKS